jgi:hypothetical protein
MRARREYTDLKKVDRFVVDNSKLFEIAVLLEWASVGQNPPDLKGYTVNGMAKKPKSACVCAQMAKGKFARLREEARDVCDGKSPARRHSQKPKSPHPQNRAESQPTSFSVEYN